MPVSSGLGPLERAISSATRSFGFKSMHPLTLRRSPVKGLLYMLAAVLAFSAMDAAAKWLTADYSVVEVSILSRMISPFLALVIALQQGGLGTLKTRHPFWHLFRAGANGMTL